MGYKYFWLKNRHSDELTIGEFFEGKSFGHPWYLFGIDEPMRPDEIEDKYIIVVDITPPY